MSEFSAGFTIGSITTFGIAFILCLFFIFPHIREDATKREKERMATKLHFMGWGHWEVNPATGEVDFKLEQVKE